MDNKLFEDACVQVVARETGLNPLQIYVVWMVKVLGNNKALVSTEVPGDGLYFEVTYNGLKDEMYVDKYVKESNTVYKAGDDL